MRISNFISKELIFLNTESENVEELINNILDKAAEVDEEVRDNLDKAKKAVLKREDETSTALGHGIVVPHGRIDGYDDTTVISGTLKKPIKAIARNKEESIELFFIILSGLTKNRTVLKLMSLVSCLGRQSEFLEKAKDVKSEDEFIELIQEYENDIKQTVTSEDLMDTTIRPVSLSEPLESVAARFIKENKTGLPVVDGTGCFVGEITERELIEFGMPKYASLISGLSFMTVGEPFEEYFLNSGKVTVRELYRKSKNLVDKQASIMEICFNMITEGRTRLYVVENDKYFGMIERRDIIKKFLHI